jgi:hypothetical protein
LLFVVDEQYNHYAPFCVIVYMNFCFVLEK